MSGHPLRHPLRASAQGIGSYAGFLGSETDDIAALRPRETLARLVEVERACGPDTVFRRNLNVTP